MLQPLRDFLAVSGTREDFVDFHKYGAGEKAVCDSQLLADTVQWTTDVQAVRAIIAEVVPARAGAIGIQDAVISVGAGTSARVHQKDGGTVSYAKPADLGSRPVVGGAVAVTLPGPSVTQVVVG
ncbi:hypothetical protein GCM10010492_51190 [Saccharothrix mutabilis subsp. mutabilis]|uniref:Uncharacterized protein n=1 Tax=Saccharothrix mutabilis subsp. mutabilis TaxID=66855 RepID=A0ABN0UCD9_9PSEU